MARGRAQAAEGGSAFGGAQHVVTDGDGQLGRTVRHSKGERGLAARLALLGACRSAQPDGCDGQLTDGSGLTVLPLKGVEKRQ